MSGRGFTALAPGSSCEFVVRFRPREPRVYETRVPFQANGVAVARVRVAGAGVAPRLELEEKGRSKGTLDFGSARVGQAVVKELTLVNKTRLPVEVAVDGETLRAMRDAETRCAVAVAGGKAKPLAAPKERAGDDDDETSGGAGADGPGDASVAVLVPALESVTYTLTFAPKRRSRVFQTPFAIRAAGSKTPRAVSLLTGACVGAELVLSRDALDFGAVVDGARVAKTTRLRNTGDVGCSFAFDVVSALVGDKLYLRKNFELFPTSGYVGPGAEQEIRATYRASFPTDDAKSDASRDDVSFDFVARCVLDSGADAPLDLSVCGRCVTASAPTATVRFSARARGESTEETTVRNDTDTAWRLRPTIANANWRGAETLFVPARGEAAYAVTYAPLAMSTEEDPHVGVVRFELPDGSVDARELIGVAEAPERAGVVEATVPAKKAATIFVEARNWLPSRARFRVTVAFADENDESVTMRGPEFLDVAGSGTRSYPLSFYGHRTGETTRATVTFAPDDEGSGAVETDAGATYDVAVTTSDPEPLGVFSLRAAARQMAVARLPVSNPLSVPVEVTARCSNARTFARREKTTIPPRGAAEVEVAYAPALAETEATSDVVLESAELGSWPFQLRLSASAAGPERGVSFTVPLGSAETKKVAFKHVLTEPATYAARWRGGGGGGAFFAAETHQASAAPDAAEGVEQSLDVTFEPTSLGSQFRDVLLITSDTGGEFVVPVSGRCVAPKPVGPIVVGPGGASASFKNVFDAETTFTCATDNPRFVVARAETIGAKQTKAIAVRYESGSEGTSGARTAKLLVTSDRVPGAPWAFYLKASDDA